MITLNLNYEKPKTCFDCFFSKKEYCWATCMFLQTIREDGKKPPKTCPWVENK